MNNENKGFMAALDAKLDAIGDKLKKKEWKVPTDLLGGVIFLVFGLAMLYIIPLQIEVKKKELVNGQAFPKLLMYIMIACSVILIVNQVLKMLRKEPVKTTTINLLVEVKAVLIFLSMIVFWLVAEKTGNFAIGSAVFGVLMLFFFRCKKPLYYAIVLVAAVAIWAAFRFGLGVLF
ncbi:MAG: tripartite tricarboxylate transporter TctB family protein [Clostridia bacterium]|nr:tripartite tricarboxylate transporter TctB family protein [Clostridia bacterium]